MRPVDGWEIVTLWYQDHGQVVASTKEREDLMRRIDEALKDAGRGPIA